MFATPGLIFESLAERRRPVLQLSPLREASRIALTSVIFTGAALVVIEALRSVWPAAFPNPEKLLGTPKTYIAVHHGLVFRTLVLELAIASLFAIVVCLILVPASTGLSRPHDALWTVLHESTDRPSTPYVDLLTADGVAMRGAVAAIDGAGSVSDRFIAVATPILIRRPPAERPEELGSMWKRSMVPLSHVVEMHISFAPRPARERGSRDDWRRWWRARPRVFRSPSDSVAGT